MANAKRKKSSRSPMIVTRSGGTPISESHWATGPFNPLFVKPTIGQKIPANVVLQKKMLRSGPAWEIRQIRVIAYFLTMRRPRSHDAPLFVDSDAWRRGQAILRRVASRRVLRFPDAGFQGQVTKWKTSNRRPTGGEGSNPAAAPPG